MAQMQWNVDSRRYRNPEDYRAALQDKKLIDSITGNLRLDSLEDVERLYQELNKGKYQFESQLGRQFDDDIYEQYMLLKKQAKEKKQSAGKKRQEKEPPKAEKQRLRMEELDEDMQKEIRLIYRKRERKRRLLRRLSIAVCLTCAIYLGCYYKQAKDSDNEFEALAALKESTVTQTRPKADMQPDAVVHRDAANEEIVYEVLDEYKTLINKNKKLIGWIKIDDTLIDYPVMQTVNNEYYLNHNFNQEEDKNGCIFMDYQCDVVKGCDNYILYGHHMQSGKMFGTLDDYSDENYYKKHPTIQFDTIYEKGTYEIMYVFRSKVYSEEDITFKYYQFINATSEKEFNSYLKEMADMSLYDTGVTASYGDQLLTLSTCDYQEEQGRFVVVAKRVN
ncbi:MAG: class B sortase [Lachnospiraceae bacterium]|nr:class B sortase [Lachnospiraceae bacterium]